MYSMISVILNTFSSPQTLIMSGDQRVKKRVHQWRFFFTKFIKSPRRIV